MDPIRWQSCRFDELDVPTLYAVLQLRAQVFVVEQACIFQDIDGLDPQAVHLMGWSAGSLQAYARCFPAGVTFPEASIGRVVTQVSARGGGWGHRLIAQAQQVVEERWGRQPVRIGAQAHLQRFYAAHGFVDTGRPYVEDGIDHLEMLWTPS